MSILMLIELYLLYILTSSISINFEEIKRNDVSFIVETGMFKCMNRKTGSSSTRYYLLNYYRIYTQYPTARAYIFNNEKVEMYFYINCKNQKEAFLINKIDKNNIKNT